MSLYIELALQACLSAILFYSCFCRMVNTDDTTVREVRLVIWYQGLCSAMVFIAPYLPIVEPMAPWPCLTTPLWVWLMLLSGSAGLKISTARYWTQGVPRPFIKPEHRPRRRRNDQPSMSAF